MTEATAAVAPAAAALLPDLSLPALARAYRDGELEPRALALRLHAAAAASAAATRAWIALVPPERLLERAAALARAAPASLPLYGVPFAVKDCIDVAGLETTAGCPGYARAAQRSATVVERLEAAGALLLGKTNLDQFSTGLVGTRSPFGAPSSAWSEAHVSGGSSSGSAVAVARGLVSFALGTDTAGSGRVPAAFNGIAGYKPTRGLLSTAGVVPACRSLDCVSVFARDVADARHVAAVAEGADPREPLSRARTPAAAAVLAVPSLAPRLAVPRADALAPLLEAPAATAWEQTLERAREAGTTLVEVDVAPLLEAGALLYEGPWLAERHAAFGAWLRDDVAGVDPAVRAVVAAGARFSAGDAFAAQTRLAALRAAAQPIWAAADALLLPTAPRHPTHAAVAADPIAVNAAVGTFTTFANLLDLCAVAVPSGVRPDGLPFGVQLLAPAFADRLLLDLAANWPAGPRPAAETHVVVCGAHMSGMPLAGQLHVRGARLVRAARTAPRYRLYALPGGPPARPGLVRDDGDDGAAIAVEVWRLSVAALGDLLTTVPAPLTIGTVELAGGEALPGFLCERHAVGAARDVTAFGGWRDWLAAEAAALSRP